MDENDQVSGNRSKWIKALIAAVVILGTSGVLHYFHRNAQQDGPVAVQETKTDVKEPETPAAPVAQHLPKLLEFGSDKCIPCKTMVPILEALSHELADKINVEKIDVWKNGAEAKKYEIDMIPVQIFLDAEGKELFRNNGIMTREDILAKWKELGVAL